MKRILEKYKKRKKEEIKSLNMTYAGHRDTS